MAQPQAQDVAPTITPDAAPPEVEMPLPTHFPSPTPVVDPGVPAGEPAGCLTADTQAGLDTPQKMLEYADRILNLKEPLAERQLPVVWNAYTGQNLPQGQGAVAFAIENVQKEYLIQDMLNALQVAGFVTWLRRSPQHGLEILAIPLLHDMDWAVDSFWEPYVQAYWKDRFSIPSDDAWIVPALKLPPCAWAVEAGLAPRIDTGWWNTSGSGWPDYAWAAGAYTAADTRAANEVARRINWLGPDGLEAANSMCGPLVWSILNDAGAFPTGVGGWTWGSKTFWLAKPTTNGRPWGLFPPGAYMVYHFDQPLGKFDFQSFPLYPGDFLYTYSEKDGFDHMLVVTEIDPAGNVYTVTNLVQMVPEKKLTIERVVLYHTQDPSVGIARNAWAKDRQNGRTGHDGFDVFRWAWMEKDINGQPAVYTVQVGDTLGLVAERWKTPAGLIAEYNGIALAAELAVDQVLQIPPNLNVRGKR